MFFNARINSFHNRKAGAYCDLEFAREIQAVSDMPPCPHTGLKEAGRLLGYYNQLVHQARMAQSMRSMQRQLGRMANWTLQLWRKAARHNRPIKLKARLAANPRLRARVLAELGGEAALLRWERLKARAANQIHKTPEAQDAPSHFRDQDQDNDHRIQRGSDYEGTYRPHRARTDSTGEFCLAPIPRPHVRRSPDCRGRGPTRAKYKTEPPVPLFPHELRPDVKIELARFKAGYDLSRLPLRLTYQGSPPDIPLGHKPPP